MAFTATREDGTDLASSRATFGLALDDIITDYGTSVGYLAFYPDPANGRTVVRGMNAGATYFINGPPSPI